MNLRIIRSGVAILTLLIAGCAKKTEPPVVRKPAPPKAVVIEVVKETERSRHFLAVSRQLELGGTLYGYADVDGDALKLAGSAHSVLQEFAKTQPALAPLAKQDFRKMFQTLGLDDIKAVGVSSVPDGTGFFRNRMFFYLPDGRHGLLAGMGDKAAPFAHLDLAPADADVYGESEIDLRVIYETVKKVVAQAGGEQSSSQFEGALKKAGDAAALSVLDLIYGLKGHAAIVLRFEPEKNLRFPGPAGAVLPGFSLLVCVDGVAPPVEAALAKSKNFTAAQAGSLRLYEFAQPVPLEGIKPVFAADGQTLFFATSREFLDQCRGQKTGLAQSGAFRAALAHVGSEGNGLSYVSPRFFARIRQLESLNPNLPAESRSLLHLFTSNLPAPDRPLVALRINLPDGILVRSYWNRSLKQEIAMAAVYNPVTIGMIAAMAIPAFQKVQAVSQEKAVLNNLRQFAAAGDQYCLENGVKAATYGDLVGPGKYIRGLRSVAGESYRGLRFEAGGRLSVRLADGRVIEYKP